MKCKNTFQQPIKNARIWVFLMDDEGKVVGNKAMWLQGPQNDAESGTENTSNKPLLDQDIEGEYSIVVDTQRPHTKTKITFSRIILQDGHNGESAKICDSAGGKIIK